MIAVEYISDAGSIPAASTSLGGRTGFDGMYRGCGRQWAGDYPDSANHKGQLLTRKPCPSLPEP